MKLTIEDPEKLGKKMVEEDKESIKSGLKD